MAARRVPRGGVGCCDVADVAVCICGNVLMTTVCFLSTEEHVRIFLAFSIDRLFCRQCGFSVEVKECVCEHCGACGEWAQELWFVFQKEELEGIQTWFEEHEENTCYFGLAVCSLCDKVAIRSMDVKEREVYDDPDVHHHSETPCFHCIVIKKWTCFLDAILYYAFDHRKNRFLPTTTSSRGNRIFRFRYSPKDLSPNETPLHPSFITHSQGNIVSS